MATDFKTIRAAIKAVIDAKIADSSKIQAVYAYARSTFGDGFPVVTITPSSNEADYGSTSNDRVQFAFNLRIYYPIQKEAEHADAEIALEEVVDELLTLFRPRNVLGATCDWVAPTPSIWEYEVRGEAVFRVAEVNLSCIKYVAE